MSIFARGGSKRPPPSPMRWSGKAPWPLAEEVIARLREGLSRVTFAHRFVTQAAALVDDRVGPGVIERGPESEERVEFEALVFTAVVVMNQFAPAIFTRTGLLRLKRKVDDEAVTTFNEALVKGVCAFYSEEGFSVFAEYGALDSTAEIADHFRLRMGKLFGAEAYLATSGLAGEQVEVLLGLAHSVLRYVFRR